VLVDYTDPADTRVWKLPIVVPGMEPRHPPVRSELLPPLQYRDETGSMP